MGHDCVTETMCIGRPCPRVAYGWTRKTVAETDTNDLNGEGAVWMGEPLSGKVSLRKAVPLVKGCPGPLLSSVCFSMTQARFTATSAPLLPPSRAPSESATCPGICELSVGKNTRPSWHPWVWIRKSQCSMLSVLSSTVNVMEEEVLKVWFLHVYKMNQWLRSIVHIHKSCVLSWSRFWSHVSSFACREGFLEGGKWRRREGMGAWKAGLATGTWFPVCEPWCGQCPGAFSPCSCPPPLPPRFLLPVFSLLFLHLSLPFPLTLSLIFLLPSSWQGFSPPTPVCFLLG